MKVGEFDIVEYGYIPSLRFVDAPKTMWCAQKWDAKTKSFVGKKCRTKEDAILWACWYLSQEGV